MQETTAALPTPAIQAHEYCSRCGAVMTLARIVPTLGSLPELDTYKCPRCGNVFTWVVEPNSRPI
jgi:DNA-directed RNA polymerase subunit RPC12/RpoP